MNTVFANDPSTTLAVNVNITDLTITVADGSQFPTTGKFQIRIEDEIMWVTAVSGNNWTVTRAAERVAGTQAAASHSIGVAVIGVLTADSLTSGAAAGDYVNPVVTLDQYGRLTSIANGTNHFFSDFGAPDDSLGLPGDYYLELENSNLYRKT